MARITPLSTGCDVSVFQPCGYLRRAAAVEQAIDGMCLQLKHSAVDSLFACLFGFFSRTAKCSIEHAGYQRQRSMAATFVLSSRNAETRLKRLPRRREPSTLHVQKKTVSSWDIKATRGTVVNRTLARWHSPGTFFRPPGQQPIVRKAI